MYSYEVNNLQHKYSVDVTGHRQLIHGYNRIFLGKQADYPIVNFSWEHAYAE